MELVEPDSFHGGKAFYDFTPRIIYKKSRMHPDSDKMDYYDGKLNHLWVDLFILDKLPKGKAAAEITRFLHKAIYGLAMGHRHDLDYSKYSLMHKIFVGGLATAGKLIPMKAIFAIQKAIALKDRYSKGDLRYYSNYQPDYLYVTLHKDWCEEVIDAPFEDTTLMIPKGWDPVLKEIYGNYMQLPPEEQRIPTHSSLQIQVYDE
jgi:lipopolysaccharide cholinephosphotransferase